jgi:hypothetical protein
MGESKIFGTASAGHAQNATVIGNQFNLGLSAREVAEEIKKAVAESAEALRTPVEFSRAAMAPPLPAQFVARGEVIDHIRRRLLGPLDPYSIRFEVLHGLGSVGKSTIAKALCHSAEINAHFSDVLWTEVGLEPEPVQSLAQLVMALGESQFQPSSIWEASEHLRGRLVGRRPLIVLDNVWDPQDVKPFAVAPGSTILITTRRVAVSDGIGGHVTTIPPMNQSESIHLLETWIGRALHQHEHEPAGQLVTAIDHLPLALQLCGSLLSRGLAWVAVRSAFEIERDRILQSNAQVSPQLARVLACIRISTQELKKRDSTSWTRFIRLGVLSRGARIEAAIASTLWNTTVRDGEITLHLLEDDALLLHEGDIYRLHDLVYEVALDSIVEPQPHGLGTKVADLHREFLNACGWSFKLGTRSPVKTDGYSVTHLTWHLEMAGEVEAIHTLLAEEASDGRSAWFEKLSAIGELKTYSADLTRASRLAIQSPHAFSLQLRYGLINSSLVTSVDSLTFDVLQVLVRRGFWGLSDAFVVAQRGVSPTHRAKLLTGLTEVLSLSHNSELKEAIYSAALEEVATLKAGADRASLSARLCYKASSVLRHRLLALFLDSNPQHYDIESLPLELHQAAIKGVLDSTKKPAQSALNLAGHLHYLDVELQPVWAEPLFAWSKAWLEKLEVNAYDRQKEPRVSEKSNQGSRVSRNFVRIVGNLFSGKQKVRSSDKPSTQSDAGAYSGTTAIVVSSSDERDRDREAGSRREDIEGILIQLLREGQLTPDQIRKYIKAPSLQEEILNFRPTTPEQRDEALLSEIEKLFGPTEKLRALRGARSRFLSHCREHARKIISEAAIEKWHSGWKGDTYLALNGISDFREFFSESQWAKLAADLAGIAKTDDADDAGLGYALALKMLDSVDDAELRASIALHKTRSASNADKALVMPVLLSMVKAADVGELMDTYQRVGDDDEMMLLRIVVAAYLGNAALLDEVAAVSKTNRIITLARMMRDLVEVFDESQLRSFTIAASEMVAEWWIVESLGDVLLTTCDPAAVLRILAVARDIGPADLRAKLKTKGLNRLIELGCVSEAARASYSIDLDHERWRSVADLAEKLANKGKLEDAIVFANLIDDVEEASRANSFICLNLARFGNIDRALAHAQYIASDRWRVWTSCQLELTNRTVPSRCDPQIPIAPMQNCPQEVDFEEWFSDLPRETKECPSIGALMEFLRSCEDDRSLSKFWMAVDKSGRSRFFGPFAGMIRRECVRVMRSTLPIIGRWGTRQDLVDVDRQFATIARWWP